ncbi:MAG: glycoside hydrolase family 25 protein [Bacteroidaceae bacterium]
MPTYEGIDISRHQKTINWKLVSKNKNIQFIYMKASEGLRLKDPKYAYNLQQAHKYGFKVGSYHYLSMGKPVKPQFHNFIAAMGHHTQDLKPMVDIEAFSRYPKRAVRDSLRKFVQLLRVHFRTSPVIYASQKAYNRYLAIPEFNRLFLYIAKYTEGEPQIKGANYTLWQYTENGQIEGIPKRVDLVRFRKGRSIKNILLKRN